MNQVELGALEQVDVREVWRHEAQDFTPWLAENLDKLSAVLHVDLEREGVEVQVGPYRADIVARIPQDGTRVLIENQLEGANLQHLGRCSPIWPVWTPRSSFGSRPVSMKPICPQYGG